MADYDDSNLGWYARRRVAKHAAEEERSLQEQEEKFANMSPEDQELLKSGAAKLDSGGELTDDEQAAYKKFAGLADHKTAAEDVNDKLNAGYTGKGKKTRTSKMRHSNSKLKKKVAVAGALAGGAGVGGALLFLALLPLKIEHIITNIEARAGAQISSSVTQETDKFYSKFIQEKVLPNLGKGTCHSTIDPSCVSASDSSSPFGRLFNAWKEGNLEKRMADKGFLIGKQGNQYYVHFNNKGYAPAAEMDAQVKEVLAGKRSLFDLGETKHSTMSRNEIRQLIRFEFKNGTLWDKVYYRFKIGKFVEQKYGIKRCLIACSLKDKISDTVANKTLAGKAYLLQRVLPEKYALTLTCVLAGATGSCDPTRLDPAEPGDTERLSPFQKQLQEQLAAYAAKFGEGSLSDLVKAAEDISKDGLKKVIARKAISSIVGTLGGDTAGLAAGEAAEKAVPVVGWLTLIAGIITGAATTGILLQHAAYQMNSATAAETYGTFRTAASEAQSGNGDLRVLGSFSHMLETNVAGTKDNSVDFTESPLWQADYKLDAPAGTPTSGFGDFLLGSTDPGGGVHQSSYRCDDGNPVPAGQIVCPEENFAHDGLAAASAVSNVVNDVPGIVTLAGWITNIANKPSDWISNGLQYVPGFNEFSTWTGSLVSGPLAWIQNQLITTPDINSGARVVDMMMAGADVTDNGSCQTQLGCAKISDAQVAKIQNEQLAEQQADFERLPLFARIFSTATPYSFVSHLAMSMPTSFLGITTSSVASLFTNPFDRLNSILPSLFSTGSAFAAVPVRPDPFGIIQYGYTSLPDDPEAYWNANCVNGPMAVYDSTADELDVSNWLNQQQQDPNTGEAVATVSNPCLLIHSSIQASGGGMSAALLPKGSTNQDNL